ncbi:hypothetical protein N7447_003485 [Penicillium robsamsonii]|uniref:uncharacterized protein n=1 Tax=Penicillium robsamsonii TaxID=1792511 RepID=UPI0025496BF7|nr:uncharacterized protein N7447_003485 [Penicillium robsamsonii]KAJ5826722.1 hypothetical protein N7447_003485 [Penicillium robsamsonii]
MPDKTPFPIPERVSSLMPLSRRQALRGHQERSVSNSSRLSQISQDSLQSATSDFLDAKIAALEDEQEYTSCIREGLDEILSSGLLSSDAFQTEIDPILKRFRAASQTLNVIKRQRTLIEEDLEVEVKRRRITEPLDDGLVQRAYMDTIIPRVMGTAAKTRKQPFDQKKFRKEVNRYYGLTTECVGDMSFCHVLGFFIHASTVKAAHLVLKSLSQPEVSHIFGVQDGVFSDPRNSLLLYSPIESLLDQGVIAVIPIPGSITEPTTWRCVVLDESKNENFIFQATSGEIIKVKHLDNRILRFLSENRPRRRYLYFRFLISYLHAKRLNLGDITEKVEARKFWPSGGEYLNKSTLKTLAQCVSGCELPDEFVTNRTFEGSADESRNLQAGMILGADIRDTHPDNRGALIESMKRL